LPQGTEPSKKGSMGGGKDKEPTELRQGLEVFSQGGASRGGSLSRRIKRGDEKSRPSTVKEKTREGMSARSKKSHPAKGEITRGGRYTFIIQDTEKTVGPRVR